MAERFPQDINPLRPAPLYHGDRFVCRPELPWSPEFGRRACHPLAEEIADWGETRRMRCPVCGTEWTEELPQ